MGRAANADWLSKHNAIRDRRIFFIFLLANAELTCATDGKRDTEKPQRNELDVLPRQVELFVRRSCLNYISENDKREITQPINKPMPIAAMQ